jgi:photosystem II stability/assembly factor-like uncharacterized protein
MAIINAMKSKLLCLACIFYFLQIHAQVKPTPATDRLKSIEQRKLLQQKSLVNTISFKNIGPTVMSGRVVDIEVNPADPTEFYVAYATGGLWHTVNNGQSFNSIFDSEAVIGIGDIAVSWAAKQRTIWIGTGEVNSSRSTYAGIGIYKSNNNGKTWDYLGLPESHHIGKIVLHPTDNNIAWVAALGHLYSANKERGMYKTIDGGKTWKQILYIDENTGAVDAEINPQNPNELYANMWYRTRRAWNFEESGSTSGLYKSIDGGENWMKISGGNSGFPEGNGFGRSSIAVFEKNPNILYAVLDNQSKQPDTATKKIDSTTYDYKDFKDYTKEQFAALDNKRLDTFIYKNRLPKKYNAANVKEMVATDKLLPTVLYDYFNLDDGFANRNIYGCEVYRSNDAGKTWAKVTGKIPSNFYSTYGYYFGKIFISPTDDQKIIITGLDVLLSTNAGGKFTNISKENVHSDHHAIWINPKKDSHIINGNDGGCNITYDNGEHWFKANTPAVGQFYSVTTDMAKPYNVYGGLQDNGVWYASSNNKENYDWYADGHNGFTAINGGDGMQVQVDYRDNKTIYSGSQFGVYNRQTLGTKERKSIRPLNDLGEAAYRFNWQTPIVLSRHNQDVFYYGSNKFHRSLNRADTLVTLSQDLTTNPTQGDVPFGTITTISESPLKFGLLYVGTDDGNIHISKDGGYTWQLITKKLPKGLFVSRVVASAFKEEKVYATLNGYRNDNFGSYVFISDDYGNNWKQICTDLPTESVNVIREDNKYDSILYIGTDGGLYTTIDAGNTSMMFTKGLPASIPVHDIAIQSRDNEIVVGTHGRSIYIAKLDSVQLLLKKPTYRETKQQEVLKTTSFLSPIQNKKVAMRKEGVDIDCPPVSKK